MQIVPNVPANIPANGSDCRRNGSNSGWTADELGEAIGMSGGRLAPTPGARCDTGEV